MIRLVGRSDRLIIILVIMFLHTSRRIDVIHNRKFVVLGLQHLVLHSSKIQLSRKQIELFLLLDDLKLEINEGDCVDEDLIGIVLRWLLLSSTAVVVLQFLWIIIIVIAVIVALVIRSISCIMMQSFGSALIGVQCHDIVMTTHVHECRTCYNASEISSSFKLL